MNSITRLKCSELSTSSIIRRLLFRHSNLKELCMNLPLSHLLRDEHFHYFYTILDESIRLWIHGTECNVWDMWITVVHCQTSLHPMTSKHPALWLLGSTNFWEREDTVWLFCNSKSSISDHVNPLWDKAALSGIRWTLTACLSSEWRVAGCPWSGTSHLQS